MAKNLKIRKSSLLTPYGVGSIIPFPDDESLMVVGLDNWLINQDHSTKIIKDDRLARRIGVNRLIEPLIYIEENDRYRGKIPLVKFPQWRYCPDKNCGMMTYVTSTSSGANYCHGSDELPGKKESPCKKKKKNFLHLVPERFIIICPEGHIDDFPIMQWVHQDDPSFVYRGENDSGHKIRRKTSGMSSSLGDIFYECTCGSSHSLAGAMDPNKLKKVYPHCRGRRPWIEDYQDCKSKKPVHVVQRGGTNVWFGDVTSSIFVPGKVENLAPEVQKLIESIIDKLSSQNVSDEDIKAYVEIDCKLKNIPSAPILEIVFKRLRNQTDLEPPLTEDEFRKQEYDVMMENAGSDKGFFHCLQKPITDFNTEIHPYFESISLVPKLKETRALVGFSRLLPNLNIDYRTNRNNLSKKPCDWVPAIQNSGEGIFIKFNLDKIRRWEANQHVIDRKNLMSKHLMHSHFNNRGFKNVNPRYVLLHTFAHIMISEISLQSGYGASAIRERIYASFDDEKNDMVGVLLYTSSGDSEGSLGGLVRQGNPGRLEKIIINAIKKASWCSYDPICIESVGQGPESCNLAACHNCVLLPETSCENGNRFLDRGLLIGFDFDKNEIRGYFDLLYART